MISASINSAASVARDSEAALRMICRAVIRRVRDEHPESSGYELFLRYWAAYPFGSNDDVLQQVFHEEVLCAAGRPESWSGIEPAVEQDAYLYAASPLIQ